MSVATKGSDEKWPGGLERALVLSLLPPSVGGDPEKTGTKISRTYVEFLRYAMPNAKAL